MKRLSRMSVVEKGKLLHELIPEEIRAFVSYMEIVAKEIISHPQKAQEEWKNKVPHSGHLLIELAEDIQNRIPKNGSNLIKNAKWFADQLFDGDKALFTIQCLQDYTRICPNQQFNKAIELFFVI